jgi:hypothetical protein
MASHNGRIKPTASGARNQRNFTDFWCAARQRMGNPFGVTTNPVTNTYRCAINFVTVSVTVSRYTPGGLLER